MARNTIPMKTYEMDKHCNLLFTRILEACKIPIDYDKDRIGVFTSERNPDEVYGTRGIMLGYTKPSQTDNRNNEYTLLILLSDHGHDSTLDSYTDEESMNTVHDVCVENIVATHIEGGIINLTYEDIRKVNRKVLNEINSTRVVNNIYFLNKDSLVTKKYSARESKGLCN